LGGPGRRASEGDDERGEERKSERKRAWNDQSAGHYDPTCSTGVHCDSPCADRARGSVERSAEYDGSGDEIGTGIRRPSECGSVHDVVQTYSGARSDERCERRRRDPDQPSPPGKQASIAGLVSCSDHEENEQGIRCEEDQYSFTSCAPQ
jgi:hypothetical protein